MATGVSLVSIFVRFELLEKLLLTELVVDPEIRARKTRSARGTPKIGMRLLVPKKEQTKPGIRWSPSWGMRAWCAFKVAPGPVNPCMGRDGARRVGPKVESGVEKACLLLAGPPAGPASPHLSAPPRDNRAKCSC